MKIAITSEGQDPSSLVDPRFGRAKGFIIYNTDSKEYSYHDNEQNINAPQGAGIQSAKKIIDMGAKVLLTGNVGPKAFATLKKGEVTIIIGAKGIVKDAVDQYLQGSLSEASEANVESHW